MTANELASQVEDWEYEIGAVFSKKVATMLRQQAKEIAILKQIIDANNLQLNIGQLKKELALQRLSDIGQAIENEPVAHRFKWEEKMSWQYGDGYDATGAPNDPDYFAYEPLYTHPMRELSDEEIGEFKGQWYRGDFNSFYDLVQAILKKAGEK